MEVSKVGSLYESQSTLCHFNRIKEKKKKKKTLAHRKSISLNLAHFLIGVKKKKKRTDRTFSIKSTCKRRTANIIHNNEKLKAFQDWEELKDVYSALWLNIRLAVL